MRPRSVMAAALWLIAWALAPGPDGDGAVAQTSLAASASPGEATRENAPGDLVCRLTPSGKLTRCQLHGEPKRRLAAAIRTAQAHGLPRLSREAAALEAWVRFPMTFDAQESASLSGPVVEHPVWLQRPNGAQVDEAQFLGGAIKRRAVGRAKVRCWVLEGTGALRGCELLEEGPSGRRVGDAVLYLTRWFRARPPYVDGVPVLGEPITLPVTLEP